MRKILLVIMVFAFLNVPSIFGTVEYGHNHEIEWSSDNPHELKIYPNPAVDYFWLKDYEGIKEIKIFNIAGKEVRSFKPKGSDKLYVGNLNRGTYLVQFLNSNYQVITTQRLKKR